MPLRRQPDGRAPALRRHHSAGYSRGADESSGPRGRADIRGREDRGPSRRHAGPDRAAQRPDETDVDGAVAELRIEAADRIAAGTGELEVDAGARNAETGGHGDPRSGDRNADQQAAALVRGRRRLGTAAAIPPATQSEATSFLTAPS